MALAIDDRRDQSSQAAGRPASSNKRKTMAIQQRLVSPSSGKALYPHHTAMAAGIRHLQRAAAHFAFFTLALLGLTLAGLSLPAAPAHATDQGPKAFLQSIYKQYVGKNAGGVPLDGDADIKRYFTPDMAKIILDDNTKAAQAGDIPTLDGDPFVGHQDWLINKFQIEVDDKATDKTTAKVSFKNLDKMETVTLDLVKVDGAWKIDDVHWPEYSLRGIYKQ
jgi:hypothetical protein